MKNSILAGNTASGAGPDCIGAIGSSDYNLIGNTSGCTFTLGTGDLTNIYANLGELMGSPGYHPLLPGSPAINAGNPAGCTDNLGSPLNADQRGAARVGRCDIGAYEYTIPGPAASIVAADSTPQRTPPLWAFNIPFRVIVLDSIGSPVSNTVVTFSAPASGATGTFADSGTHTTTAMTNVSGFATAATFTANGLTGSYTVIAMVDGVSTPATFLLTNVGWYVAPGGNDSNSCQSSATPCATINGALSKGDFISGDSVLVAGGTYTSPTGNEVVLINKSVTLSGGWDNTFITQNDISVIDGEGIRRVITVNGSLTALVQLFAVQNGSFSEGGGIHNKGNLILDNSIITNNTASGIGGGIRNDSGAALTLVSAIVSNNRSGSMGGGGIDNSGTLTIRNSSIIGNTGSTGGGILNSSSLVLNNSTVSGNHTGDRGGGVFTIGTASINSSTISRNTAGSDGGGIYTVGTTTLQNTIVAGNTANNGLDCIGTFGSAGYNLIGNTSDCTLSASTGDLLNINPLLFGLIGSPGYQPLLRGSPAIDAGNPTGCTDDIGNPLDTDQRGVARVGRCDIGSYEYDPANDPVQYRYLPLIQKP